MRNRGPGRDVVVVGGGIVGLATARALLIADPSTRVTVLEKEARVGLHQSTHNSGVLHAGVYYRPGSLKARLCRRGKELMENFAADHDIPVAHTGKLVVAVRPSELDRLDALAQCARSNGVPGLCLLGTEEMAALEPHINGLRALHSPGTAVIDFGLVCDALAADVHRRGGEVRTGTEALTFHVSADLVRVTSPDDVFESRTVVACAGLQADRLARQCGHCRDVRIVPFRGTWFALRPAATALIRGNVYPVPDPRFPFLGVHFTRRADGAVWAGPNAVLAGGREAYARGTLNPRDIASAVTFPGTWRLARRYLRTGAAELYRDQVRRAALRVMRRYLPELTVADLLPGPNGIRAQAVRADGTMVDDFLIQGSRRVVHVLNAPSPGATSSLAIGELLAVEIRGRL
jgi:L-2-hydroxyglutarate oxidase LhgO